ncbi:hypothetical protein BLNAU_2717 [Blattamonas nauphoetae]|uniref:Uncharacterized protein n=1 Tax=Blattamonas nauphoetae TaxID=2049346 RepID=A0ABQ9YFC8_9EUKA|nr:hypothetical protein BLNAU_2717 [Blattamonas nauphoetae]
MEQFSRNPPCNLKSLHHPLFIAGFRNLVIEFLSHPNEPAASEDGSYQSQSRTLQFISPGSPENDLILNMIIHEILSFDTLPSSQSPVSLFSSSEGPSSSSINLEEFALFLGSSGLPIPCSMAVKWFTESVLWLAFRHHSDSTREPLGLDDILIDPSFSFHIKDTSANSPSLPLNSPSTFSSDLSILASFMSEFINTLLSLQIMLPPMFFSNQNIASIITLTFLHHAIQRRSIFQKGTPKEELQLRYFNRLLDLLKLVRNTSLSATSDLDERFRQENDRSPLSTFDHFSFLMNNLHPILTHDRLLVAIPDTLEHELKTTFPRHIAICETLREKTDTEEWREFRRLVEDLGSMRTERTDLGFLSSPIFVPHLRAILEEAQSQTLNTANSMSDSSTTQSYLSSSLSLSPNPSSIPFDADQPFFTSFNERPPSPSNSERAHFSESETRVNTNPSDSNNSKTTFITSQTLLTSKERMFMLETIHTLLSRQKPSRQTPSTLTPFSSNFTHLQTPSDSPPVFSSSIFDLDDQSLSTVLNHITHIVRETKNLDHIELSQQFVNGLVSCLGSTNLTLSTSAHQVLRVCWTPMILFLCECQNTLIASFKEGTYNEKSIAVELFYVVFTVSNDKRQLMSETLFARIFSIEWRDIHEFIAATKLLESVHDANIFEPHTNFLFDTFVQFVTVNTTLWKFAMENAFHMMRNNTMLNLQLLSVFLSSKTDNRCTRQVVDFILSPAIPNFTFLFFHFYPVVFLQTFPLELFIEREMRSCTLERLIVVLKFCLDLVINGVHRTRSVFSFLHPFLRRGFHQILLSPPNHSSRNDTLLAKWRGIILLIFFELYTSNETPVLALTHPIENFLSLHANLISFRQPHKLVFIEDLSILRFASYTPFGECPALRTVFAACCDSSVTTLDVTAYLFVPILSSCALVASHSVPTTFDSPLLAFVRSRLPLSQAARVELDSLLCILRPGPLPPTLKISGAGVPADNNFAGLFDFHRAPRPLLNQMSFARLIWGIRHNLQTYSPVVVSLALLALSRLTDTSQQVCLSLLHCDVLNCVLESVTNSPYLEDYEHACAIISALLRTSIQQTRRNFVKQFHFSQLVEGC